MENPKIKIESDGVNVKVYLNGEEIRCVSLDFHGDVTNRKKHLSWDGVMLKLDEDGMPHNENGKIVTEHFHYENSY